MTEKRFELAYETNDQQVIWWAVRDGDITLWKEEVVDTLNTLSDENEQLKQFIQSLAEQSVNGKVMLRDGKVYDLNKILKKGDVE